MYQVSHLYDKHGYDPKAGKAISTVPIEVLGKKSKIVYKPSGRAKNGEWGRFQFNVRDKETTSLDGTVVIVPPSKVVVASDFTFGDEGWKIVNNGKAGTDAIHDPTSRGLMNHYIYGREQSLNIQPDGSDGDFWYFELPSKFYGWQGIAYGGRLEFDLSSFSGNYSTEKLQVGDKLNLVEIECKQCSLSHGERFGFPLKATKGFHGNTSSFSIPLTENSGWLKDPKNTLKDWVIPTKCEFIQMLSGISSIRILGDFTTWYETVSIDNVRIVLDSASGRYQLPVCAQSHPRVLRCDCK